MTFAIFIVLVFGVFIALLNLLPAVSAFSFDAGSALTTIIAYMKAWDFLFPITETLILVGIMIAFELSIWIWHVSWRIVKFLRGHSDGA